MLQENDILNIIGNELSQSDSTQLATDNQLDLEGALDYYLGEPNGREVEGRSSFTSTDVADAIEWILPQIMKSFTQNNEVVQFDPVMEGDEVQAELESEYVYDILMKQNDGFIILHQFIKDALMQRNGILKVYYAEEDCSKSKDYTGITDEQLQMLVTQSDIEVLQHTVTFDEVNQMNFHDVKIKVSRIKGQIYVESIPPEEFRVNSTHNSINLNTARFTAHVTQKTISEIMTEYSLSKEQAKQLNTEGTDYTEYRDDSYNDESEDFSQKLVEVAECFLQIDVEETGISKLMKITTVGADTPTDILLQEEIESMPWVSTTAFLMSHKWQGISITDRLKEIQDQKTALVRNMFDNLYLQNNQRNLVVENQVNLDDLMVSRPGGIIRAKRADAVVPLSTPQIGSDAFTMMNYLDTIRAGRTGVDADGAATPQNIGDRVGSQGVERLMNAKEELVGLIIRVVAETGVKPLCVKIRDLAVKHLDAVHDFRFKGTWYKINPALWETRVSCTVRVGTGSGNQTAKVAALQFIMQAQSQLGQTGTMLVNEEKGFAALDDFCKFSGLNGAGRYFVDPTSPEGQQAKQAQAQQQQQMQQQEMQIQQAMAESQTRLAEAENAKAQAQQLATQLKGISDQHKNELQAQKQQYDVEIASLKQQLDEAKLISDNMGKDADLEQRKYEADQRAALELTRMEIEAQKEQNNNYEQNQGTVQ